MLFCLDYRRLSVAGELCAIGTVEYFGDYALYKSKYTLDMCLKRVLGILLKLDFITNVCRFALIIRQLEKVGVGGRE